MDFDVSNPPLEPVPQELPWASEREMLHEILTDLSNQSVYDFLLRTSALFDVNFLSSPRCAAKGISTTSLSRVMEQAHGRVTCSDIISVHAILPTHMTDEYSFAVGVCSLDPTMETMHYFLSTELCTHYALNLETGRITGFSFDECKQLAMIECHSPDPDFMYSMTLYFELQSFLQSFQHQTIDFNNLTVALLKSSVMQISRDIQFPKMLPNYTGSVLTGEQFPEICRKHMVCGNLFVRITSSDYEQGARKKSTSSTCLHSMNIGTHHGTFDTMRQWALRFKLASIKPVLKYSIPSLQITNEEDANQESSPPGAPNTLHRPTISIAPAQIPSPSANHVTYAEKIDDLVAEKKLRRKIKNRIAAAKSNERRRLRRQLDQLQSST